MSGGGGKPRQGRMCLGKSAPQAVDTREAAAELARSETEFEASKQASADLASLLRKAPRSGKASDLVLRLERNLLGCEEVAVCPDSKSLSQRQQDLHLL